MTKINRLRDAGFFGTLDAQMAGLVARMHGGDDCAESLLTAVALASRAIRGGHACVDLGLYAGRKWADILDEQLLPGREDGEPDSRDADADLGALPLLEDWKRSLGKPAVGDGSETGAARTLFVLRDQRLYLRRYRDYECKVEARLQALNLPSGKSANTDELAKYFNLSEDGEQLAAAANAIEKRLSLLNGGPGTGKTYTLATVVAMLTEMALAAGEDIEICMAAPTGKAAVRMAESITEAKARLKEKGAREEALNRIPENATTIHRLLGARYQSPYFKHDANNPLSTDMVIVDEASMVDLPLMAKLLDALPPHCRLMLVGDVDQLASVEPGRVYGDVCRAAGAGGPLNGCLTSLTKSRRFPETSVIGKISRLVNDGNAEDAWMKLRESNSGGSLCFRDAATLDDANVEFTQLVKSRMAEFMQATDAVTALTAANNFRILCAVRKGPHGVIRMNRRVERILANEGLKPNRNVYDRQIIMITVNTPSLQLYNGDVGVILAETGENDKQEYLAWFPDQNRQARSVPVSLLPEHETAFAMTVHKSQGSEFACVALVLPGKADSPILTRELLYTGMTRVKIDAARLTGELIVWCTEAGFKKAVRSKTVRATGLFDRMTQ